MKETYELVLILKASLDSEAQKKLLAEIKKQITGLEGKVIKEEEMGKRVFAYKIKKEKEGCYFILTVELSSDKIKTLDEKIKSQSGVLRYLVLRKE